MTRLSELTEAKIAAFCEKYQDATPEVILAEIHERFDDIGVLTAFGYSGIVLLEFVRRQLPDIEIFFVDTRRHFPETLALRDYYRDEVGLNITTLETGFTEQDLETIYGFDLHENDADLCCRVRKVEPLMRLIQNKEVILSALRREQSPTRQNLRIMEKDTRGMLCVYPIIGWSSSVAWEFIRSNNLRYNPLHDRGYPSIGCSCCTIPVEAGGDERQGRWTSIPKLECGIHKHFSRESTVGQSDR